MKHSIVKEAKPHRDNCQVQKFVIKPNEKSVSINTRDIVLITRGGHKTVSIMEIDFLSG